MENGDEVVNGFHSGVEIPVEDEIMEPRVEESAEVKVDESKDLGGEDVSKETAEVEDLRVNSQDTSVGDERGSVEFDERLDGSLQVDQNLSEANKVERFEEVIAVPDMDGDHEVEPAVVVVEDMVEDLDDREALGKLAMAELTDHPPGDAVPDKVVKNELNGFGNNGLVIHEEDETRELVSNGACDDTSILQNVDERDGDSDLALEKSERGISVDAVPVNASEISEVEDGTEEKFGVVTDKFTKAIHDNVDVNRAPVLNHTESADANKEFEDPEEGDGSELVLGDNSSHQEAKSNGKMHQFLGSGEVQESSSDSDTKIQDDMSKEPEDASAGFYSELLDAELNGSVVTLDGELRDDHGEILKEEAIVILDLGCQDDMERRKETPAYLDIKEQHENGRELKDASVIVVEQHEERCNPEDNLCASIASIDEGNVIAEVQSPPASVGSAAENGVQIQPGVTQLQAEKSKVYQPQGPYDKDVEVCNVVAEETDNKGAKPGVNGSTQANREHEIKTAANVRSSGESANSASTPARPAGLGRAAPLLEPASRAVQQQPRVNGAVSQMQNQLIEDPSNGDADENDETREKLQMIRVKFLRLAHRLGQTPHNVVVAQVLYRLGLAEQLRGRNGSRVAAFSFDRASAMAEQLEAAAQEPLDFSCTIMVLGKSGVGKSATINSIFDEVKFSTDAFKLGTKKVQDVVGTVQGIKVRVIDTPGLLPSWSDQRYNEKVLHSIKRFISKTPPDIVLYLDRLDIQSSDFGDLPLLRTITEIFGPSIWFNAIVVLTHAASAPPEGPNGTPTSYDMFVSRRSQVVQQAIRQAAGDMRLLNPVSLVENHSACRTNRAGQRVLPNGQVWKPHLLLLSFASKILAEANALLKLQDSPPGKPFASRTRAPPLPFLLSSFLQSRPQLKIPEEQFGDDDSLEDDLDVSSGSDEESEFDELPPFKRLTKAELAELTKAQKKAYYEELEYREKLFMKKQLKEEKRRRKMMKKMASLPKELPIDYGENVEEEGGAAGTLPVPMPDLSLPATFDSDNPSHRYRCLDSNNQWLVRPVLDSHGWDHDVGYEGINVERLYVVKEKIPVSFSGQVTKDKKDATLQLEVASSLKHGEGGKATSLGFEMQNLGKDIAYTLRSETRFSNYRRNKATAGLSVTVLGDDITAAVKVEDKLIINKQFKVVASGGALTGRGDVAYGGSLEATLRDKDYPLGRFLTTFGCSVLDWHGDLALGYNLQTHIPVGRSTNLIGRFNLNNRGSGQVSLRLNSSEQMQLALVGIIPILLKLLVPQEFQFGQ